MYRLLVLISLLFLAGCGSGSDSVTTSNIAPVADAGQYQYLDAGSIVHLDGSASSDANGDALTYIWTITTKPSDSNATLSDANTSNPYFTADRAGRYEIKLIVSDGSLNSAPKYVRISTGQYPNQIYTPSNNPLEQHPMLVIRLEFDNQIFVSNEATWQQKLFGANAGELNHYYHEISQNQFEFVPVANDGNVTNGITTIHFFSNHPDPDINSNTFAYDLHPTLKQAIEAVRSGGFDFSVYDTDGNSAITPDELIVTFIMAGAEDAYDGGITENGVWAHQWCTADTYTPIVNGVSVMGCSTSGNYAVFGERHRDSLSVSHDATVGIIAHELGHSTFSLPDLYDTNSAYGGISYYGLMANGTWGQKGSQGYPGDTPTHMTAWSKIDVGWYSATPTSNDINADVVLNASGTSNYNIIKTPVSISSNEYFLVENRGSGGYDEGLRALNNLYGGGIAVWHVDEGTISANRASNSVNDNTSHKGVDLEEANLPSLDNSYGDPEANLYYSGNKTEFTPYTTPNNTSLYTNEQSYIFFTGISSPSNTMTLRINNPL